MLGVEVAVTDVTTNIRDLGKVQGGDIAACLSSTDINKLLSGLVDIDCALFFRFRADDVDAAHVRGVINDALDKAFSSGRTFIFFVAHFRRHWIALRFSVDPDRRIVVFDSAPSPMVQRDVRRLASTFGWPAPVFAPSPHQVGGSDECGLFALAAVLLGLEDPLRQLPTGTFTLHPLRALLRQFPTDRAAFLSAVKRIYGFHEADAELNPGVLVHFCAACNRDIPVPTATQRANIVRTHALSKAHIKAHARALKKLVDPSAGADDQPPAPTQCSALTQSKRGGRQCSSPVAALSLCRMHLLLSKSGSDPCTAISRAGRLCTHRAVSGLNRCPFHVDDPLFSSWVSALTGTPLPALAVPDATEVPTVPALPATLVDALAAVDDPDLEDELASIISPWASDPGVHIPSISLPQNASFADLRAFVQHRGNPAHPLASLAWKRATLLGHARSLRSFFGPSPTDNPVINAKLPSLPFVRALLEIVDTRRRHRRWKWTSTLRAMAEVAGALRNLPVSQGIGSVTLSDSAEWLAAIRGVAGQAKSERPRVPKAATAAQILAAIRAETRRPVRLLLALTWLCCGRTGDCRLLSAYDLALNGDTLTVTFRHGKTISRRGAFSLHTVFPAGWLGELGISPGDVSWASQLHLASVNDVLAALRRIAPDLENRSIRRGALQSLAQADTSEDLLLLFSGHTSVTTLRRYLAWGAIGSAKKTAMTAAALSLAPSDAAPTGGAPAPARPSVRCNDPYAHGVLGQSMNPVLPSYADSVRLQHHPPTLGRDNERWLQFLGVEAPPLDALPIVSPLGDPDSLPMMSKDVAAAINTELVVHMLTSPQSLSPAFRQWSSLIPAELRTLAVDSLGWLHDSLRYEQLLARPIDPGTRVRRVACCRLPAADFEMQQQLGKYERAQKFLDSPISLWCRVFAVPEWHKQPPRRRHIAEPLINDRFTDTPTIKFRGRHQRHQIIGQFAGGFATTLDLASYFDQFPLHPDVRPFFGVRLGNRRSRLKVLPMGFRPAAQVAQVLTWLLCAGLEGPDVKLITYIDNILILARSAQQAESIRRTIRERARLIGAIFNPDEAGPSQQFEFLGESFDLAGKEVSVSLSAKTIRKLNLLDEQTLFTGIPMSKRQLAAVVGLALFASGSGLPHNDIFLRYRALRFYRDQLAFSNGRMINQWDDPISAISPQARDCFTQWLSELKRNEPRSILCDNRSNEPPAEIIFTDASESGWGAIHCRPDGSVRVVAQQWTPADHAAWKLSASTASEPLAISRALCRFITPALAQRVIVYTDHSPVIHAVGADCARAFSYWQLQRLLRSFPVRCVVRHIPGSLNPADGFSRGHDSTADPDAWAVILRDAVQFHRSFELVSAHGDGGYGVEQPEWLPTARNPSRPLCAPPCARVELKKNILLVPSFSPEGKR